MVSFKPFIMNYSKKQVSIDTDEEHQILANGLINNKQRTNKL